MTKKNVRLRGFFNYKTKWGLFNLVLLIIVLLAFVPLLAILGAVLSQYTVRSTRRITVRSLLSTPRRVVDTDGTLYDVNNNMFLGFFTAPELFASLEEGGTYVIHTYGRRIPWANEYPNIIRAARVA